MLVNGDNTHVWIGASDQDVEGVWRWHTSKSKFDVQYANWAPGVPKMDTAVNCVIIDRNYIPNQWNEAICGSKFYFICSSNSTQMTTPNLPMCDEDWTLFENKCYKLFKENKNFVDSSNHCKTFNGSLASIKTPQINEFIKGRSSLYLTTQSSYESNFKY